MKSILLTFIGIISTFQICFADAEKEFIEKIRTAQEGCSVETYVELHYGGIPEELKPMIERRWNHEIKKGSPTDLSIRLFESEDSEKYNAEMKVKGVSYIRTAPATAFLVFTYKKESASVPISLVDGVYYIASIKPK
jgi:hypothetical protein